MKTNLSVFHIVGSDICSAELQNTQHMYGKNTQETICVPHRDTNMQSLKMVSVSPKYVGANKKQTLYIQGGSNMIGTICV